MKSRSDTSHRKAPRKAHTDFGSSVSTDPPRLRGFARLDIPQSLRSSPILAGTLLIAAIHSCGVGMGLIIQNDFLLHWSGFAAINEPFFPAQGGVFHILMVVPYVFGALRADQNENMILFAIIVKTTAAVFLLSYFLLFQPIWMVLFSGITDAGFAILIVIGFIRTKRD